MLCPNHGVSPGECVPSTPFDSQSLIEDSLREGHGNSDSAFLAQMAMVSTDVEDEDVPTNPTASLSGSPAPEWDVSPEPPGDWNLWRGNWEEIFEGIRPLRASAEYLITVL